MSRPPRGTVRRAEQVVSTLMLEGFQTTMNRMRVARCASLRCRAHCSWRRWTGRGLTSRPWPEAVKRSLIRLGPTFIKIGQILSVRSDLIPAELADALHSLQSEVPPANFGEVRSVIEAELGRPLEEAFVDFEVEPIGAGSLAMVYRAVSTEGSDVAVKVKRPGIDEGVRQDLEILEWLAEQFALHLPESRAFRPTAVAEELKRYTLIELDFRNEAAVTSEVAAAFSEHEDVVIPRIHHASEHLIIMDFVKSFALDDVAQLAEHDIDGRQLVRSGVQVVLMQMFEAGLFHGDPHPGNVRVTPHGKLVMLDFGIFGRLDDSLRRGCALVLWTLSRGDVQLTSFFLLRMATLAPDADVVGFRRAIEQRYRKWQGASMQEYSIAQLAYEEFTLGGRHGVELPAELILLGKALVTIEGAGLSLFPEMDLSDEIGPYLTQVRNQLFTPQRLKEQAIRSMPMWWDVIDRLPLTLAEIAEQRITNTPRKADDEAPRPRLADGVVASLVPAGLILGGSYTLAHRVGPHWQELSMPGAVLVLSGLLAWMWTTVRGRVEQPVER